MRELRAWWERCDGLTTVGAFTVGLSAVCWSWSGLDGLAVLAGGGRNSPLLPVCVDALAMVALRVAARSAGGVKRYAASVGVGCVIGSFLGNAMYHAVRSGDLVLTWPWVVVIAGVPSLSLGLVCHLVLLQLASRRQERLPVRRRPASVASAPTAAVRPTQQDKAVRPEVSTFPDRQDTGQPSARDQAKQAAREWAKEKGRLPSPRELMGCGFTEGTARRALNELNDDRPVHLVVNHG